MDFNIMTREAYDRLVLQGLVPHEDNPGQAEPAPAPANDPQPVFHAGCDD
jgi:hypothetical protein